MADGKLLHEKHLEVIEAAEEKIKLHCSFGTYSDLAGQMLMLPSVKRSIYNFTVSLSAQVAINKLKMQAIENRVMSEVADEKISAGLAASYPLDGAGISQVLKPRFSNDKMREAEQFRRLSEDSEYQKLKDEGERFLLKLKDASGNMEYVCDLMSRNKALVKLLEVDRADRGD